MSFEEFNLDCGFQAYQYMYMYAFRGQDNMKHISKYFFFRDLHDIGCYAKVIDGCQQLDKETRYIHSKK